MEKIDGRWLLSPRDLISELECEQRLNLDWAVASSLLDAPPQEQSDEMQLLIDLGVAHEKLITDRLRESGTFQEVGKPSFSLDSYQKAADLTLKYAHQGIETIAQAVLFTGEFIGFADFLILRKDENGNPLKDSEGRFVYDPVDAKSARAAKRAAVLQVASYAHAMIEMGIAKPLELHLWLGGDGKWSTSADNLLDLVADFTQRIHAKFAGYSTAPNPLWAAPREACVRCRWQSQCEDGRRAANDLSLVQNIRSTTRLALVENGIRTVAELAEATDEQRPTAPKEVSKETFSTLRAQAALQIKGAGLTTPLCEVRDFDALGLMPNSDPGDIWFDMEGDPFAQLGAGLEYMFGYTFLKNGQLDFSTFDAIDRASEKEAFKNFIDYVLARQKEFPQMHIYHYAAYEPAAMLRLALRHGIYEYEVDSLIRDGVFVDLYTIVRRAFRFSTESMSIKYIEAIYQDKRDKTQGVSTAVDSVIQFEKAQAHLRNGETAKFEEIYASIRNYNKDDCDSTFHLDRWIREKALALGVQIDSLRPAAREKFGDPDEAPVEPIALQLIADVPVDPEKRTATEQGLALLSAAISFHRREERPAWRAIFERADADLDELEKFNDVIVPTSVSASPWGLTGRQRKQRRQVTLVAEGLDISQILEEGSKPLALYENAPDGFKQMQGSTRGFSECEIVSINGSQITIEETEKTSTWDLMPIALIPPVPYNTHAIQSVLRDNLGAQVLSRLTSNEPFPVAVWSDLLLKNPPRQISGQLSHTGDPVRDIVASLRDSNSSYVAVQGPPGTGKTYVGGQVIAQLAKQGWRIGVVAQSHAVIENVLDRVHREEPSVPIGKKGQGDRVTRPYHVSDVADWLRTQQGGVVVGGTVWNFSAAKMQSQRFDLMVIDEAGQFSLTNALAVLSIADRGLFLGDPQQLPQVSQANHPEPVEVSVLGHILGEHPTIPEELGYFLGTTYRLHPALTEPVSQLQYEGKLHAAPQCSERALAGIEPGLHIVEVDHIGNTLVSIEESDEIVKKIQAMIGISWSDVSNGQKLSPRPIELRDILVVAAYNKQVRQLKTALKAAGLGEIKVGTFDKFQGQEAPIVFVSMATSSSEDLPRGIEFLLSPNRLNVAISRAMWVCYLYRSPQLSIMAPTTPDGMVMLGKFVSMCKGR